MPSANITEITAMLDEEIAITMGHLPATSINQLIILVNPELLDFIRVNDRSWIEPGTGKITFKGIPVMLAYEPSGEGVQMPPFAVVVVPKPFRK